MYPCISQKFENPHLWDGEVLRLGRSLLGNDVFSYAELSNQPFSLRWWDACITPTLKIKPMNKFITISIPIKTTQKSQSTSIKMYHARMNKFDSAWAHVNFPISWDFPTYSPEILVELVATKRPMECKKSHGKNQRCHHRWLVSRGQFHGSSGYTAPASVAAPMRFLKVPLTTSSFFCSYGSTNSYKLEMALWWCVSLVIGVILPCRAHFSQLWMASFLHAPSIEASLSLLVTSKKTEKSYAYLSSNLLSICFGGAKKNSSNRYTVHGKSPIFRPIWMGLGMVGWDCPLIQPENPAPTNFLMNIPR